MWFGCLVLKSLLGFARQWSREKLAILSLKPLIYRTWTIVLPDLLIYFTTKLESLTNASDASTELILQFPCKLKKSLRWENLRSIFFFKSELTPDQTISQGYVDRIKCTKMQFNIIRVLSMNVSSHISIITFLSFTANRGRRPRRITPTLIWIIF